MLVSKRVVPVVDLWASLSHGIMIYRCHLMCVCYSPNTRAFTFLYAAIFAFRTNRLCTVPLSAVVLVGSWSRDCVGIRTVSPLVRSHLLLWAVHAPMPNQYHYRQVTLIKSNTKICDRSLHESLEIPNQSHHETEAVYVHTHTHNVSYLCTQCDFASRSACSYPPLSFTEYCSIGRKLNVQIFRSTYSTGHPTHGGRTLERRWETQLQGEYLFSKSSCVPSVLQKMDSPLVVIVVETIILVQVMFLRHNQTQLRSICFGR